MSLANQFLTLKKLSQEFKEKSVVHILQRVIDADIIPVVPVQPDWHVFFASDLALQFFDWPRLGLIPNNHVFYMQNILCIELEKNVYAQLIQKGHAVISTFDTVHIGSSLETEFIKQSAKEQNDDFSCSSLIPKNLLLAWPCYPSNISRRNLRCHIE